MRSKGLIRCLICVLVLSLGGCATKSTPTFNAKYYPECYDPIEKLCKDQSNKDEVTGAVVGGLIGAIGGAVIGGLTTGKVEGALVGAGAGAVAGAVTGFFSARLSKIKNQEQRLNEYQNILGEKSKGWDLERASVERSYKCYGDQIKLLTANMKAKRITREEFRSRMEEIYNGIKYINTYWAGAQTRMDEDLADGDAWLQKEDQEAAKKQQALKRIQRQKANTAQLRVNKNRDNDRVNQVKNDTMLAARNAFKDYLDVDRDFAFLNEGALFAQL